MFNLTDTIICFLSVFYAYSGWRKGFIRSILGPVSFIVCAMLAWLYFKKTHNVLVSFSISFLGPLLINQFVSWMIDVGRSFNDRPVLIGSTDRWLGSVVALVWGMTMSLLVILFLAISPLKVQPLQLARTSILSSLTFSVISPRLSGFLPKATPVVHADEIEEVRSDKVDTQQPAMDPALAQTPEFTKVFNDVRVKDLLADPEVEQLMKDKDYLKLLQNPKFAKLLEDPQLIARIFQLQSKINKK